MEQTLHLLGIVPSPNNKIHLVNIPIKVVGKMKHLDPSEMHEQYNMVGVESKVPSLIGKVFHDDPHQGCIPVQQV